MGNKSQKKYDEVDAHKIISFDIFDTLVLRDVISPSDIFDIVEYKYNKQFSDKKLCEFKAMRMQAERTARENKKKEILLDEIYRELEPKIAETDLLKQIEMQAEYMFAAPNIDIKKIYDYAKQRGKRIILVSDMYLPKSLVASILQKCGYTGYEKLYLSSDLGDRKRNGALFHRVLNDLKCSPGDILHIGDNIKSDYKEPRKLGISAINVPSGKKELYHYKQSGFNIQKIPNNVFTAFVYNRTASLPNQAMYIGYTLLGLPLFGFCQWLHHQTEGMQKYFLARDGFLIKSVYEIMYPDEKEQIHYLYISRNSLRRPNIYAGVPYEVMVEQMQKIKTYSADDFSELCYVSEQGKEYLRSYRETLQPVEGRDNLMKSDAYRQFFEKIKIIENAQYKQQYDDLKAYLKRENFSGRVAVVDVGWRGSAQINLQRICGEVVDIIGYYFGVEDSVALDSFDKSKMKGYFWGWDKTDRKICNGMLKGGKGVFECMFLSDEGSTVSYGRDDGGNPIPVRSEDKTLRQQQIVKDIQNGAVKFAREFAELVSWLPLFQAEDAAKGLLDFIIYPQRKDTSIGDILIDNFHIGYLAKPNSIKAYLKKPTDLFRDLKHSSWKIGFLRRLLPMNRCMQYAFNAYYRRIFGK